MIKHSKIISSLLIAILILPAAVYAIVRFGFSQDNISYPAKDHGHFRLQYVFHGTLENFADTKYQTPYDKGQCDGSLTKEPMHLHDSKAQIVHLHWARVTGGEFLKNYGVNLIGGQDDKLGYQLNELNKFKVTPIPIFGKVLPQPSNNDKFWVYSGDKDTFKTRGIDEFKNQDMEKFFGVESQVRKDEEQYGDKITFLKSIKVNAENSTSEVPAIKTEEELKVINNLLGNVILFVQPNEPTQDQIKKQFEVLEPLSLSTCGG